MMSCDHFLRLLEYKVPKTYREYISNDDPKWLDMIKEGKKTYVGQIFAGDWKSLNPGDKIEFYSGSPKVPSSSGTQCLVKVKSINRYDNFGDAFDDLGQSLVPIPGVSRKEAKNLCMKFFYSDEVILYGVIAIKIELKDPPLPSVLPVPSAPPLPSESEPVPDYGSVPDWVSFVIINIFLLALVCMFMWI